MPLTSPSVLLIRLDAVGDALALAPLLAALRAQDIPVDLVLRAINARALAPSAARRTFEAPFELRSSRAGNLAAIASFGSLLAQHSYTHVLIATEDPGGYRLARAIGAPARIGFVNGWGKPFKTLWARAHLTQPIRRAAGLDARALHECEVLFELGASLLGNGTQPARDRATLRPLVLEREPEPDERVLFQVTDTWERLGIAFPDVVAAARDAAKHASLRPVAAGVERAYARRFSDATGLTVEHFDALEPWKAAIGAARAIVAPDSGALHVAGMVGTPTVAVFPPQREFALQVARWAPWAAPHQILEALPGWAQRVGDALARL